MTKSSMRPSTRTIKRLFALSGNRCAFHGCSTRLVDLNSGSVVGEVCHIKGDKPTAPRYDADQDNRARQGFDNLIVLCNVHHKIIDDNPTAYPVDNLLAMKAKHESCQSGKESVDNVAEEAFVAAITNTFGDHNQIVQAVHVSGGQVAHTINNNSNFQVGVLTTVVGGLAALLGYVNFKDNPVASVPTEKDKSVVFGQIEISTHECAWEPMSRPCHVVAPIRNIVGKFWGIGGPPIGEPPRQDWAMGSHQLFPLRFPEKIEVLDKDPIFNVTLVNKGSSTCIVSRIGIRPIAAWTSPKGPPFSGRLTKFDSYSLEMNGFEIEKDQFLLLAEPISLVPNDPYRLQLRLSGYCRTVPRNETVVQLVIEVDQETIASEDIYLGLHTIVEMGGEDSSENESK